MAVDYTTLFTRLGRYVAETNLWLGRQGTDLLAANVGADDILDEFAADRQLADGVLDLYLGMQGSMRGHVGGLTSLAQKLLAGQQGELAAPSGTMAAIVPLLIERMKDDSQTVKANTVGTPSVTAASGNAGNGGLAVSTTNADGVTDETVIAETLKVRCVRDQYTGTGAGYESFEIVGQPKQPREEGYLARGSGGPTQLAGGAANSLLTNGAFSEFTANQPDGWTVGAGVVGADILENVAVLHAYDSTLELKSAGSSTITLSQNLTAKNTKRVHVANVWVRRSGGSWTGGGLLTVKVKGTGLADKTVLSMDPGSLTASFANFYLFLATPASLPDDYRVEISWTGANLNAGKSVYVSGCAVRLATMHGGIAYALFRGDVDFLAGDDYVVVTTNDYGGKFQTWFGRFAAGAQLPSSGSPTINDTLAA
jgi:hypothetical protein